MKIKNIILSLILMFTCLIVILYVATFSIISMKQQITDINCCERGYTCSDTYYTPEDNLCHYSLCESSLFTDKENCTYEGANISINITN